MNTVATEPSGQKTIKAKAKKRASDHAMSAHVRAHAQVMSLRQACEQLLQMIYQCPQTDEVQRAIVVARAALANGDDVTVRMGCQVLLRCMMPLELGNVELIACAQQVRQVLDRYYHLLLQFADAGSLQHDALSALQAERDVKVSTVCDVLARYKLSGDVPIRSESLALLINVAQLRYSEALAHLEQGDSFEEFEIERYVMNGRRTKPAPVFRMSPWDSNPSASEFIARLQRASRRQFDCRLMPIEDVTSKEYDECMSTFAGSGMIVCYAKVETGERDSVVHVDLLSGPHRRCLMITSETCERPFALALVNYLSTFLERPPFSLADD